MINQVVIKGIITYKSGILITKEKKTPYIEFGLAYNSITAFRKVYKQTCVAKEEVAKFIHKNLNTRDIILITGFLTTRNVDCHEKTILNVVSFEPIKTSKNVVFTDKSINESLFTSHIRGFDE
jgi:hypothetical protein